VWFVGGDPKPGTVDAANALGMPTLALVAQRWTIAILLELHEGPLRPHELERRLAGLSHGGLMRRLAELATAGAVTRERTRDIPPRAYYTLAPHGRTLLTIVDHAARWEEHTHVRSRTLPGAWALRAISDQRSLRLLQELSHLPLGPRELGRRVAAVGPMGHAALMRRVTSLAGAELLTRTEHAGRVVYGVLREARLLAALPILAMSSERHRLQGPDEPSSDLLGMLRVLIPGLPATAPSDGICSIAILGPAERERRVQVPARNGSLELAPLGPPAATKVSASTDTWLALLADGRERELHVSGDRRLAAALVHALTTAIGGRGSHCTRPFIKIS
jgi:DNA-binding HxlR family transcriptional regulator